MEILRDLSIFWAMFHVIFVFIMLFRSRYAKKKIACRKRYGTFNGGKWRCIDLARDRCIG